MKYRPARIEKRDDPNVIYERKVTSAIVREMVGSAIAAGTITGIEDLAHKMDQNHVTIALVMQGQITASPYFKQCLCEVLGEGFEYEKWFQQLWQQ